MTQIKSASELLVRKASSSGWGTWIWCLSDALFYVWSDVLFLIPASRPPGRPGVSAVRRMKHVLPQLERRGRWRTPPLYMIIRQPALVNQDQADQTSGK